MTTVNWLAILRIIESICAETGRPLPGWAVTMKNAICNPTQKPVVRLKTALQGKIATDIKGLPMKPPQTTLTRRCSCGKLLSIIDGQGVTGESHGFCPECLAKAGKEADEFIKRYLEEHPTK